MNNVSFGVDDKDGVEIPAREEIGLHHFGGGNNVDPVLPGLFGQNLGLRAGKLEGHLFDDLGVIHPAVLVIKPRDGTLGDGQQLGRIFHIRHIHASIDLSTQVIQVLLGFFSMLTSVHLRLDGKGHIRIDHLFPPFSPSCYRRVDPGHRRSGRTAPSG